MGIQINGQTDTISATDGGFTIDGASGNLIGNLTGNVTGNLTGTASTATAAATAYGLSGSPNIAVGIITATSFSGDGSGLTGVGGGSSITAGNTSAEVIDTGSNGSFVVTTEGSRRMAVYSDGKISIGPRTTTPGELLALETLTGATFSLGHSGQNRWIIGTNNTSLTISDLSAEVVRIDNSGLVDIKKNGSNLARLSFNSASTRLEYNDNSGHLTVYTNSTARIQFGYTGGFWPVTDNSQALGLPGQRWTAVYAVNGTIQTSDLREKTDVATSSLGADFIKQLRPVSYKFKVGENVVTKDDDGETDVITPRPGERTHWGFIAQEVKEVVDAAGVDFGGWILTDKEDPDSTQGLRYDQFIAPLTKALQEALEEIETLKAQNATQASAIEALTARLDAAGL